MALWSNIVSKLKEILKKMIGSRTIEQTLHVSPIADGKRDSIMGGYV